MIAAYACPCGFVLTAASEASRTDAVADHLAHRGCPRDDYAGRWFQGTATVFRTWRRELWQVRPTDAQGSELMDAKVLPGGIRQVEGSKGPHKRKHRKPKRVVFDRATTGGGTMNVEHENPTGEYPNPHADTSHVFTNDHADFHGRIVPHLAKAMGIQKPDGSEPDADDEA